MAESSHTFRVHGPLDTAIFTLAADYANAIHAPGSSGCILTSEVAISAADFL
jgi:hypothetical protein